MTPVRERETYAQLWRHDSPHLKNYQQNLKHSSTSSLSSAFSTTVPKATTAASINNIRCIKAHSVHNTKQTPERPESQPAYRFKTDSYTGPIAANNFASKITTEYLNLERPTLTLSPASCDDDYLKIPSPLLLSLKTDDLTRRTKQYLNSGITEHRIDFGSCFGSSESKSCRLSARDLSYRLQYTLDLVREMSEKTQAFLNSHAMSISQQKQTNPGSSLVNKETSTEQNVHGQYIDDVQQDEKCEIGSHGSGVAGGGTGLTSSYFCSGGYSPLYRNYSTKSYTVRNGPVDTVCR